MTKIDWTKWSAIAEILSAIAIVFTLVYLSTQTRYLADQTAQSIVQTQQNNALLEAQARYNHQEVRSSFRAVPRDNREFAEILVKADRGEVLLPVEQLQLESHWKQMFSAWEWEYFESKTGRFDLPVAGYRNGIQGPGALEHWEVTKGRLHPEFVAWVDKNVVVK